MYIVLIRNKTTGLAARCFQQSSPCLAPCSLHTCTLLLLYGFRWFDITVQQFRVLEQVITELGAIKYGIRSSSSHHITIRSLNRSHRAVIILLVPGNWRPEFIVVFFFFFFFFLKKKFVENF